MALNDSADCPPYYFSLVTNDETIALRDLSKATYSRKAKPPPVPPTGANMWMKNGERCLARWLLKDHAFRWKPKAQHHSRRYCRQTEEPMSGFGCTKRTWRDVRLESVMQSKSGHEKLS